MEIKKSFIQIFEELFHKGEILKSFSLVNYCVPLELKDDPQIKSIREMVNSRIDDIRIWSQVGRVPHEDRTG